MTCVGSQEQAAISRKWRRGEGQEMKLEGQAGPPEREEGPASLLGSTDFILKGVTEGF